MKRTMLLWLLWLETRAQEFAVSYASAIYTGPFNGNVVLSLSPRNTPPKDQPGWPCYRLAVRNVQPGQTITFSDSAISSPTLLSRLERGTYYVQAVWNSNREGRIIGQSTGNPYSAARQVTLGAAPVFVKSAFCR